MSELDFWNIKWIFPRVPEQHIITEFLSYLCKLIETRQLIINMATKGRFFHGPDNDIIEAFDNIFTTLKKSILTTVDLINHYGFETFEYGYSSIETTYKLANLEIEFVTKVNRLYLSIKSRSRVIQNPIILNTATN